MRDHQLQVHLLQNDLHKNNELKHQYLSTINSLDIIYTVLPLPSQLAL